MSKLNERQVELLRSFQDCHEDGLKSPPYFAPFGMSRMALSGEGQPMAGLVKRGLVEERNNLFYITDTGLAAVRLATGAAV